MKTAICLSLCVFMLFACDKVGDIINGDEYQKPDIEDLIFSHNNVNPGDTVVAEVLATNPEEGLLSYEWEAADGGLFVPPTDENIIKWVAPGIGGEYRIKVTVRNDEKSDDIRKNVNVQSPAQPLVNITSPSNGEFFVQNENIEVSTTAYHDNRMSFVRITARDYSHQLTNAQSGSYSFNIPTDETMVGELMIVIEAEAFGQPGNIGADSIMVNVEGIILKRGES